MGQTIYQLTQAAALTCSHLPVAEPFDPVAFLEKWQTLIGSIIGALMGVVGALIVATRGTRRDRRLAASSLLPEVMKFRAKNEEMDKLLAVAYLNKRDTKRYIARQLIKKMPEAHVIHSLVVTQLYDLDRRLYAHLTHCQMIHPQIGPQLERFRQADNANKAPAPSIEDAVALGMAVDLYAQTSTEAWSYAAEHALLAEYYLDRLIFGKWAVWMSKLRMRLLRNDFDRRSAHLIKTGQMLLPTTRASKSSIDENTPL
ncbi:hypothetical protein [Caballeronia sp. SBC2]|uniref:hypothetical protein n=1 Tax=Caballeronia sp. SBC2 TaxID=2705547 RepID=UPI0013E0EF2B|nr:hypothetical protein [Caballeronia sp. SBC2]QIE22590.1 hypothetical protein SBC2_06000 [Caballeronia sp. SBC2]